MKEEEGKLKKGKLGKYKILAIIEIAILLILCVPLMSMLFRILSPEYQAQLPSYAKGITVEFLIGCIIYSPVFILVGITAIMNWIQRPNKFTRLSEVCISATILLTLLRYPNPLNIAKANLELNSDAWLDVFELYPIIDIVLGYLAFASLSRSMLSVLLVVLLASLFYAHLLKHNPPQSKGAV